MKEMLVVLVHNSIESESVKNIDFISRMTDDDILNWQHSDFSKVAL